MNELSDLTFVEGVRDAFLGHVDLEAVALEEGDGGVVEHADDLYGPVSHVTGQLAQDFGFGLE